MKRKTAEGISTVVELITSIGAGLVASDVVACVMPKPVSKVGGLLRAVGGSGMATYAGAKAGNMMGEVTRGFLEPFIQEESEEDSIFEPETAEA